jgi:hypothetical protein
MFDFNDSENPSEENIGAKKKTRKKTTKNKGEGKGSRGRRKFNTGQSSNEIPEGTPVDIFTPANQPEGKWVWTSGYTMAGVETIKKVRHQKLPRQMLENPLTKELERCYAIKVGAFVFPVVRSHVRVSSPNNSDVWIFPASRGDMEMGSVSLTGFLISDESDKADLAALESGHSSELEDEVED